MTGAWPVPSPAGARCLCSFFVSAFASQSPAMPYNDRTAQYAWLRALDGNAVARATRADIAAGCRPARYAIQSA